MSWDIQYTAGAKRDLYNIYQYIVYDLLEPETAQKQLRRIVKGIRSLEESPMRHRLYDEEPWKSQGTRFFPVDNYVILYLVNESNHTVFIAHVIYGGRNLPRQMRHSGF